MTKRAQINKKLYKLYLCLRTQSGNVNLTRIYKYEKVTSTLWINFSSMFKYKFIYIFF